MMTHLLTNDGSSISQELYFSRSLLNSRPRPYCVTTDLSQQVKCATPYNCKGKALLSVNGKPLAAQFQAWLDSDAQRPVHS